MAGKVSGVKTQIILQAEETGAIDRYGVDMLTRVEMCPTAQFPTLVRRKGSVHPRFMSMQVSRVDWSRERNGQFYRITYLYEGFLAGTPDPTYELAGSNGEKPIQLHPDFATFGGSPSAPANAALFVDPETGKPTTDNAKGVFREFRARNGTDPNPFAGIESYLSPGATWTETSFSSTRPSGLGDLGRIDSPSGTPPTFTGLRTWLFYDVGYRQRGGIFETRKTWLLSDTGGWNTTVY